VLIDLDTVPDTVVVYVGDPGVFVDVCTPVNVFETETEFETERVLETVTDTVVVYVGVPGVFVRVETTELELQTELVLETDTEPEVV